MSIPIAEQRRVCMTSGNRCAFDGCRRVLSVHDPTSGELVVLGEMAHMIAESPDGPRGDPAVSIAERNGYENLLLLCQAHHQLIDNQPLVYTVERLRAMKKSHESWVSEQLGRGVDDTITLAPIRSDTLYATVLPVQQMPRFAFSADVPDVEVGPRSTSGYVLPYVLQGNQLWAFQDLRRSAGPFADVVVTASATRHAIAEWIGDPDRERLLQQLLNRCLNKLTGHRGLHLDKEHHRYYFAAETPGESLSVSYVPLNKESATRKVVWRPTRRRDASPRGYWLHRAVSLRFRLIDRPRARWVLSLRPELHVTTDGVQPLPSRAVGRRVTRSKARRFNHDLLGEVQFWRDYLSESAPRIILRFDEKQRLVVSTSLLQSGVWWPGLPAERAMPFRNVEFLDDLFTWAEGQVVETQEDPDDGWDDEAPEDLGE